MATFFKTWQQWVAVAAVTLGLAGAARAEEAEAVETPEVTQAKAGEWITDYDRAAAAAAELGRPMLLDFTGSDWCGWCIKLDDEVFSKPEFTAYAKESLVLVKLDFPRKKKLPEAEKKRNAELSDLYGVRGYPTIILVDAEGNELGRTGYRQGGAEAYVGHLQKMLEPVEDVAAADGWLTDFKEAQKQARETGRPMLLDFTGSDWCGWCIRLDEEVFSKPEFTAYAEEALVLVKLDFPQDIPQSRELIRQNEALMEQYGVEGFPTIILVDADGEVLAETGYRRGGAEAYVKHLKELLKK